MINYLKSFLYTTLVLVICAIIITLFNYFNIINGTFLKILYLVIPLISVMIGSFVLGKKTTKKGYVEGLIYGAIWVIIFLVINIILKGLNITSIIFFMALILLSIISSIFGKNRKRA